MKFKLMNQEAIYLAGVVHYGELEKKRSKVNRGPKGAEKVLDDEFRVEIEEIRKNAKKIRDQVREELNWQVGNFKESFAEEEKAKAKEDVTGEEASIEPEIIDIERSETEDNSFESVMSGFGKKMEEFGRYVDKNAPKWESGLEKWGKNFEVHMENFGKDMENWGENFGAKMNTWGENFGKDMEEWGKQFGEEVSQGDRSYHDEAEIKGYSIYQTYKSLYNEFIQTHPDHIKQQTFYEVQIFDSHFDDVVSMVMVGSRMSSLDRMKYPVATMTFAPDRWVAVKMSKEEFEKDWLGSLEQAEQLRDYTIDAYFIRRHREDDENDVRLFCPVKEKEDER